MKTSFAIIEELCQWLDEASSDPSQRGKRIAVIGSGPSGLSTADAPQSARA
ncbi:MAG: hypothetical protein ACLVJ6_00400 [Merdibacter sp.]